MVKKVRVGVLAGGASAERQISLATGIQIMANLPPDRYEVVLLDPLAHVLLADLRAPGGAAAHVLRLVVSEHTHGAPDHRATSPAAAVTGAAFAPAAQAQGNPDISARLVPADAPFYSAALRNREQYDLVVNSRAFKALKELPAVQQAWQAADLFLGIPVHRAPQVVLDSPLAEGPVVVHLSAGGAAQAAGLRVGDAIVEVEGTPLGTAAEVAAEFGKWVPLVLELPREALGAATIDGSSPSATVSNGRLVVTGPFASGTTAVQVGFRLPYNSSELTLSQVWPAALQRLKA